MTRPVKDHPSVNFDDRPEGSVIKYLIFHYTERDFDESLRLLSGQDPDRKVSSHYMICEAGEIYRLVPEDKRAWHAGLSSHWGEDTPINQRSIGIELVNNGQEPFKQAQMEALVDLSRDIVRRHNISPFHILGHSDIAPDRKVDPGEHFDWQWLASQGIGIYPDMTEGPEPTLLELQHKLKAYGYRLDPTGHMDQQTEYVLRAFTLHFGKGSWAEIAAKLDWLNSARLS